MSSQPNRSPQTSQKQPNILRLCTLNVCGLKPKLESKDFETFISKFEIICVIETKLGNNDAINIPNYEVRINSRKGFKRASGGVAVFIKTEWMKHIEIHEIDSDFMIWFSIKGVFNFTLLCCVVYIPPHNSDYSNIKMFDDIEDQYLKLTDESTQFCLLGDLNARIGSNSRIPQHFQDDHIHTDPFDFPYINDHNIEYYLSSNNLPLTRTSQDSVTNEYGKRLLSLCTNLGLYILNGRCGSDKDKGEYTCDEKSVVDYIIGSGRLLEVIEDFQIYKFDKRISDKHSPVVLSVRTTPTQEDAYIHLSWEDGLRADFMANLSLTGIQSVECLLQDPITLNQKKMDDLVSNIRKFLQNSADTITDWKMLHGNKSSNNETLMPSISDFCNHFKSLNAGEAIPETIENKILERGRVTNEKLDFSFTLQEVEAGIDKLKPSKALGSDNIINEFIKCSVPKMSSVYVDLFNRVLESRVIPTEWQLGYITPIYTGGDPSDVTNYRGITIYSCLGQLFTSLLYNRLSILRKEQYTIDPELAGYPDGFSCTDLIFTLKCLIDQYLNKKKRIYALFVDHSTLFDEISRIKLGEKLLRCNITGKLVDLIFKLYRNAKSRVKVNDDLSETFSCLASDMQRDSLSHLLFAIYLRDLKKLNMNESAVLYAYDTVILAETEQGLQQAVSELATTCNIWKLILEKSQTKIVVFCREKIRKLPTICFNDQKIEVVREYLYLGVLFNYDGSFKKATSHLIDKANKAMFDILSRGSLDIETQLNLFDTLIVPILLYGCEVWGADDLDSIERVQLRFCKYILGVKHTTPDFMVYGQLAIFPLEILIKSRIVSYWHKCTENKKNVLQSWYPQSNGWFHTVKSILDEAGLSCVWETKGGKVETEWLTSMVTSRLKDKFLQKWSSSIFYSRQCVSNRIFNLEDFA